MQLRGPLGPALVGVFCRAWIEITLTGPTPGARVAHAMAYDRRRQRLGLYGGFSGGPALDDTWEWDGANWTEIK